MENTIENKATESPIIVVDGESLALDTLRADVALGHVRSYGNERRYAKALNTHFSSFEWFDVEHTDDSENGKLVKAEKKALFKHMKQAEHTNPSTAWARIRNLGREERHGKPGAEAGAGEAGEGEGGKAEGNGPKHERSPRVRYIDDLLDLYKMGVRRDDELDDECRRVHQSIIATLAILKVDVTKLAK
jgi:hypothetical protein